MFVAILLVAAVAVDGRRAPKDAPAGDKFMTAKTGSIPALQPTEVYDSDYPIDSMKHTPQELRYRAQADYARALAALKREAAEAAAAKAEMERLLKELTEAKNAAASALENARRAKAAMEKLRQEKNAADANAHAKGVDMDAAHAQISKEQADLDSAEQTYKAASQAETEMKAKIAELQRKHDALCKESEALEAERRAASGQTAASATAVGHESAQVNDATADLTDAQRQQQAKAAAAAHAQKDAEAAKQRLAHAEELAKHGNLNDTKLHQELVEAKKIYEDAKARWMREDADVKAATVRVNRAKQELAKYEEAPAPPQSAAAFATPAMLVLAVVASSLV